VANTLSRALLSSAFFLRAWFFEMRDAPQRLTVLGTPFIIAT
jgi:hypothetical protein